jgi:DNA-directed RNA polymerase subunit RPC12/RpoP
MKNKELTCEPKPHNTQRLCNPNRRRFIYLSIVILLFAGCGKHESEGGTVGAASGAAIGSAVSSKKNKGTGTLVGALLGNYVGRQIGRKIDEKEDSVEHEKEITHRTMQRLELENRSLRKKIDEKWCRCCKTEITIPRANNCPYCGSRLIIEKYCRHCNTSFNPDSEYNYCPYCRKGILLSFR